LTITWANKGETPAWSEIACANSGFGFAMRHRCGGKEEDGTGEIEREE